MTVTAAAAVSLAVNAGAVAATVFALREQKQRLQTESARANL